MPASLGLLPAALPVIAAGASLIDPLSRLFTGLKQKKMARKIKPSKFIPPSLQDATSQARTAAYSSRSLDQGVAEAELRKQQANQNYVIGQQGTTAQRLAATASLGNNFTDRMMQLMAQGRNERYGRIQNYENQLLNKANVEMENQRVYEGAKSALRGASMQNIHGFWSGLGDSVGDVLGTMAQYRYSGAPSPQTMSKRTEGIDMGDFGKNALSIPKYPNQADKLRMNTNPYEIGKLTLPYKPM